MGSCRRWPWMSRWQCWQRCVGCGRTQGQGPGAVALERRGPRRPACGLWPRPACSACPCPPSPPPRQPQAPAPRQPLPGERRQPCLPPGAPGAQHCPGRPAPHSWPHPCSRGSRSARRQLRPSPYASQLLPSAGAEAAQAPPWPVPSLRPGAGRRSRCSVRSGPGLAVGRRPCHCAGPGGGWRRCVTVLVADALDCRAVGRSFADGALAGRA